MATRTFIAKILRGGHLPRKLLKVKTAHGDERVSNCRFRCAQLWNQVTPEILAERP
jgi:hypothetical protein